MNNYITEINNRELICKNPGETFDESYMAELFKSDQTGALAYALHYALLKNKTKEESKRFEPAKLFIAKLVTGIIPADKHTVELAKEAFCLILQNALKQIVWQFYSKVYNGNISKIANAAEDAMSLIWCEIFEKKLGKYKEHILQAEKQGKCPLALMTFFAKPVYVCSWVTDRLAKMDENSKSRRDIGLYKQIEEAIDALRAENGDEPTMSEVVSFVAEQTGKSVVSIKIVYEKISKPEIISLDEPVGESDEDGRTGYDRVSQSRFDNPEVSAIRNERAENVHKALGFLNDIEIAVLGEHFNFRYEPGFVAILDNKPKVEEHKRFLKKKMLTEREYITILEKAKKKFCERYSQYEQIKKDHVKNYIPEFDKESDDEWFEDMLLDAFSPD